MQQIELELHHFEFHCPATGQTICDGETLEPSPATLFIYFDEDSDLQYSTPEVRELWDTISAEEVEGEDCNGPFNRLLAALESDTCVSFATTICGMAYFADTSTVRYGIDMDYAASKP
jgi:hypothetical protein